MFLKKINLQNFRNYKGLELEFAQAPYNFLFGENAQGKSSFLEALFSLALGKSYAAAHESEVIRWGENYAFVRADIENCDKQSGPSPHPLPRPSTSSGQAGERSNDSISMVTSAEVNYARLPEGNNINKNIRINNKHCPKIAELIKHTFFIHFSPHDFNLVKGTSGWRRKFLDFLTTQIYPVHLNNLLSYNKCLAERNAFLRKPAKSLKELDVWNEQLIKFGSAVIFKRLAVIEKFTPVFTAVTEKFFMPDEAIGLEYQSTICRGRIYATPTGNEIISFFKNTLKQIQAEEFRRKMTLIGPHRDDFTISINAKPARQFASFGQQHSLALALKLAQAKLIKQELGQNPILLLDDCFVGLDKHRQNKVWAMLKGGGFPQIFITSPVDTDIDFNSGDSVAVYEVRGGKITRSASRISHLASR